MYRPVIFATLSALSACAAAPSDDVEFSSPMDPVRAATELAFESTSDVSKVAGGSANLAGPTQSDGGCEVVLSIDVDDGKTDGGVPFIALGASEGASAELRVWAQNRSPRPVTFRYLSPGCPAPALIAGLPEGYDAYGVCRLPACDRDAGGAKVVLRPGQRIPLGRALVSTEPTVCNEAGLAPGHYVLSAWLGEVDGARACTRQPFALAVR